MWRLSKQGQDFRRSRLWPCTRYAMVVLDLNMPDMHGLDVLKFLRSHSQYRALPVMVLTTRGDESSREEVLEAGATSYMTKPFSPNFLVSSVRELLDTAPDSSR